MDVTVTGTDILLSDLERMMPSTMNVDDALKAGGEILAEEIRTRAPVGTGRMKSAVKVHPARTTVKGRTISAGIKRKDIGISADSKYFYPAHVEYGHGGPKKGSARTPPHPYLKPAREAAMDKAWNAVKQTVINQMNAKGL